MKVPIVFTTSLANVYQLRIDVTVPFQRAAFKLESQGRTVAAKPASDRPVVYFNLDAAGTYTVRGLITDATGADHEVTGAPVAFDGVEWVVDRAPTPPVRLVGVSRTTIGASLVIGPRHSDTAFVSDDRTQVGQRIFGRPVVSPEDVATGARLLAPVGQELPRGLSGTPERFDLNPVHDDVLNAMAGEHSALGLHKVARQAHFNGLDKVAEYLHHVIYYRHNCRLFPPTVIGEGTVLGYGGIGLVIHKQARIGKNCMIGQNVTIGMRKGHPEKPVIGDNVFIGPGSVLLGGRVGKNVVIGAGSVVLSEVPDNCVVAGNPARIIREGVNSYKGYNDKVAPSEV